MRQIIPILLILLSAPFISYSQKDSCLIERNGKLILTGSYYYPEQWPEEQWERDLTRMSDMGFDFTHFAEFSWSALEPEKGKFNFAWLDKAIEIAYRHGLKVVLCTPTPTPPVWLSKRHPGILVTNENGIQLQHGTRQHASWSSSKYRKYVKQIVTKMAERYGSHPAVIGWQIDNEPSHYGIYDYSNNAQNAFRKWLEGKYINIDSLNYTWGTSFWSETYQNFNQIRIPNQREFTVKANPHAMLDFKRFSAHQVADFVNFQCRILRQIIDKSQWITTNTMPYHLPVDPILMKDLDFHSYTRYLITGHEPGYGNQGFRIGSVSQIGIPNDTYRNLPGKIFGVMELQPGQVNWGSFNPQPMPGAIRLWIYHIYLGGGQFVCNYRFRQPLKGSEQYHYGMMMTDGITPSPGGIEYMTTISEFHKLQNEADPGAAMPKQLTEMRTAIMYNKDNDWEMDFQPQTYQWSYFGHMEKYYNALISMGVPIDIISSEQFSFENYPVIIAPSYELLDEQLIDRWKSYVEQGGHLILTCRSGQKNREAKLWETQLSSPIYNLTGIKNIFYDHLPENQSADIIIDGKIFHWNNWGDIITPSENTDIWAKYDNQFYKDKAAIINHKFGKGSVTYIGVDSDDGNIEKYILRKLYKNIGKNIMNLPDGIVIGWRDGLWIGLNYSSESQHIEQVNEDKILLGSSELGPCGVVVWKQ